MDATIESWIAESPYTRALGVELEAIDEGSARLLLPYRDENSNPGKILHGGCAASLAAIGSQAVGRAALGADSGPWAIAQLQVDYLSAAIDEDVVAGARLLRRGRALCFVEVEMASRAGKPIASATAVVRARSGVEATGAPQTFGEAGEGDPGPLGPYIEKQAFIAARGIRIEHMVGGRSRLVMPQSEANADLAGGVHEGAVLALLDTTGAMASWAESGPGRFKASTASMQIQTLAPPPAGDLVAHGRCVHVDGEMYWSDAEVAEASSGRVVTRGTVLYRLAP